MSRLDVFCQNKIAIVTGAGSGIGLAIARLLARSGARVHCVDLNGAAAAAAASELGNAQAHQVDVTDAQAMCALADAIYASDGRVDLLFNNAGIAYGGMVADTEPAGWRLVFEVNVMGVVNGLHAFLPRMLKQPQRSYIVNTASGAGLIPQPQAAPYAATKHAVVGLSTSLAAELRGSKVGVTILCPGIVNTPILEQSAILEQRLSGREQPSRARVAEFYEKNGTSVDKIARDVLNDVRRNKLFCLTPRMLIGFGWFLYRLSPRLAIWVMRARISKIMGEATNA